MDRLKKLVADRLATQLAGQPHPDAELLSAFAENALSPQERQGVLDHLGTCAACREVLFLALPSDSDTQKVLAVPKARPRFSIGWATAAACVVIGTAVFVGRHQLTRTTPSAQKAEPLTGYVQPPTVAMEKPPAEIDALRESQAAAKTAPAPKAVPEAKHITAKPSIALDFKKSGQVVVQSEPRSDLKLEANTKDLSLNGRSTTELTKITPGAATTSPNADMVAGSRLKDLPIRGGDTGGPVDATPANAPALSQNSVGQSAAAGQRAYAYSPPGAFDSLKQVAVAGVLGGTVVDPTGAVVPNAKITTVGPAGTKTVTSDRNGKFSFDQLPAGEYALKVAARGFKETQLQQVAVLAGKPSDLRVALNVGSTSETVEVSAAAVALQTDAAEIQANHSVKGAMVTTTESKVIANEKAENSKLSRKEKKAAAKAGQDRIGGAVGTGAGGVVPSFQWTLSPDGAVQRSLDRGATWQSVSTPDQARFRTLSAIGGDIWVGGNAGTLYHSADSGQHWSRVVPEVSGEKISGDITRIDFSDRQKGVVETSGGRVWTTSDGGQSWQRK